MTYDKKSVTINQAINKNHNKQKRIKLELANGNEMILDSLFYKGNELYGSRIKSEKELMVIPTGTETIYTSDNEPYTYYHSTVKKI